MTHLLVDRSHDLPVPRLIELAELGRQVAAQVLMIWSDFGPIGSTAEADTVQALLAAGIKVQTVPAADMATLLPSPHTRVWPPAGPAWPRLPAVDFTTFRAACRRQLGPAEFTRVDAA